MELLIAIDEANLDVYETRVLMRIARRVVCFESQRSMAESMKMSLGKLNPTMKKLAKGGWIVPKADAKTGKMGWALSEMLPESVPPHEQVQQLTVPPHGTRVPPHEHVPPHERHLKEDLRSKNKKEREEKNPPSEKIPVINGIPMIESEPPQAEQADKVDVEMWATELNQIVREGYFPVSGVGKHLDTAVKFRVLSNWLITTYPELTLEKFKQLWAAYWQSTGLQGKPWLSQVESLADEAINYKPTSGSQNGKVNKQELASAAWAIVRKRGRRGYKQAVGELNGKYQYVKAMGNWTYVCGLKEPEFKIQFYQAINKVNTNAVR